MRVRMQFGGTYEEEKIQATHSYEWSHPLVSKQELCQRFQVEFYRWRHHGWAELPSAVASGTSPTPHAQLRRLDHDHEEEAARSAHELVIPPLKKPRFKCEGQRKKIWVRQIPCSVASSTLLVAQYLRQWHAFVEQQALVRFPPQFVVAGDEEAIKAYWDKGGR